MFKSLTVPQEPKKRFPTQHYDSNAKFYDVGKYKRRYKIKLEISSISEPYGPFSWGFETMSNIGTSPLLNKGFVVSVQFPVESLHISFKQLHCTCIYHLLYHSCYLYIPLIVPLVICINHLLYHSCYLYVT